MYKVEFTTKYLLDVALVIEYIAAVLCNPIAANKLRNDINDKIQAIKVFPEGFPEFDTEGKTKFVYRKVRVRNYYILYHFDSKENIIVFSRFVYCKMDLENIDL